MKLMEDFELRHRRQMRHHYTVTSNVLLMGYEGLSDGAKVTYQVIDSFDWSNSEGLRKGYAFPSKQTLGEIRGVGEKTIQRHLVELEQAGLVTRESRPGRPNLLIIEDPSTEETEKYLARFERGGEDKNVQTTLDKNVHPNKKQAKTEEFKPVNEDKPVRRGGAEPESLGSLISRHSSDLRPRKKATDEAKARREYIAREILSVLKDEHSLGFYRKTAATVPQQRIFETLGLVKEYAREGKVRESRGALFVRLLAKQTGTR